MEMTPASRGRTIHSDSMQGVELNPQPALLHLEAVLVPLCKVSSEMDLIDFFSSIKAEFNESEHERLFSVLRGKSETRKSAHSVLLNHLIDIVIECLEDVINSVESGQCHAISSGSNDDIGPLFSIKSLRIIYTGLELVWFLRLQPVVAHIGNFHLKSPPLPKSILITRKSLEFLTKLSIEATESERMTATLRAGFLLQSIACNEVFSNLMLQRNMDRILFTFLALNFHGEQSSSSTQYESIVDKASTALDEFIYGPFRPVVVSSSRRFSAGPQWLRIKSCQLLTKLIMNKSGGLEAALRGFLDDAVRTGHLNKVTMQVVKFVTSIPTGMDRIAYCTNIAEQCRQLVLHAVFHSDSVLMTATAMIITRISFLEPSLCGTCILVPLCAPLLAVVRNDISEKLLLFSLQQYNQYIADGEPKEEDIAATSELIHAIITVFNSVTTACPLSSPLVQCLEEEAILRTFLLVFVNLLRCNNPQRSIDGDSRGSVIDLYSLVKQCSLRLLRVSPRAVDALENLVIASDEDCSNGNAGTFHVLSTSYSQVRIVKKRTSTMNDRAFRPLEESAILKAVTPRDETFTSLFKGSDHSVPMNSGLSEEGFVKEVVQILCMLEDLSTSSRDKSPTSLSSGHTPRHMATVVSEEKDELSHMFISSSLFIRCLKRFLQFEDFSSIDEKGKLQNALFLATLQENLPVEALLRSGHQILELLQTFVELRATAAYEKNHIPSELAQWTKEEHRPKIIEVLSVDEDGDDIDAETTIVTDRESISCVMAILGMIVSYSQTRRGDSEEKILHDLLPTLQKIAFHDDDEDVASAAHDLALLLLNRETKWSSQQHQTEDQESGRFMDVSDVMNVEELVARLQTTDLLQSESPAMRAYGVRLAYQWLKAVAINEKSQQITATDAHKMLRLFSTLLQDADSFVYMNTLLAVKELGNFHTSAVFEWLLEAFESIKEQEYGHVSALGRNATAAYLDACDKIDGNRTIISPYRCRAMLAEAVMLMLRNISSTSAKNAYKRSSSAAWHPLATQMNRLINVSVKLARSRPTVSTDFDKMVDLQSMRMQLPSNVKIDSTAGTLEHGANSIQKESKVVGVTSVTADEFILRQSAVSILAESLAVMPNGLDIGDGTVFDIMDIGIGTLQLEIAYTQGCRAARRSAAFLISHTIFTMSDRLLELHSKLFASKIAEGTDLVVDSKQSILQKAHRCLQQACSDKDRVVVFHAKQGLAFLQSEVLNKLQSYSCNEQTHIPSMLRIVQSDSKLNNLI